MSAYRVGTGPAGGRIWWAQYDLGRDPGPGYSGVRDATPEESALMDKVVWKTDTDAERHKLLELIAQ